MSISYFSAAHTPYVPSIFLVGTNRSGKTLLGNLLGSCNQVEHIDEPWLLMQLTIMAGNGLIAESLAQDMFQTYLYELLNDRILMRHVNFRKTDLSYIPRQKTSEEIAARMADLQSRTDVRNYLVQKPTRLVITLTNTGPYSSFFEKAIPNCKMVYVIRDGFQVAGELVKKQWLSDEELKTPHHSNLYRKYVRQQDRQIFYLPLWVENGKEEKFLGFSEYARALYYWRKQNEMNPALKRKLEQADMLHVIRFSDLVSDPCKVMNSLSKLWNIIPTPLTEQLLTEIKSRPEEGISEALLEGMDEEEMNAVKTIDQQWGLNSYQSLNKPLKSGSKNG